MTGGPSIARRHATPTMVNITLQSFLPVKIVSFNVVFRVAINATFESIAACLVDDTDKL